jgi:D-alanyl-D-alanine carboxypeptidase
MHRAGVFDVANNKLPDTVPPPYGGKNYIDYVLEQDANHQFTFDELVRVNAAYGLGKAPGLSYEYSNTGYSILGKIVERVSGKTYGAFVTDELMTPNQLWRSSLPSSGLDQTLPASYVEGYIWDGTALANVTKSNMSANVAEGNVITTPAELSFWVYRLLRGEAGGLNKATVEMMKSGLPSTGDATYGLGIVYSPKLGYGHTGAHAGYLTLMFYLPEKDVSYVLYANVWDLSDGMTSLGKQIEAMGAAAGKVLAKLGY